MGLRLKLGKTHVTHTLLEHDGRVGFDFLGFHIRQYRVGQYHTRTYRGKPGMKTLTKPSHRALQRHIQHLHTLVHRYRGANQAALIAALNPVIRGWTRYYRASASKRIFSAADHHLHSQLYGWARWRHPRKTGGWRHRRYWRQQGTRQAFGDDTSSLARHDDTPIVRHVKVQGDKSPYNGDWVYWGERLQRDPTKPQRVLRLLKRQQGRCEVCGLRFTTEDKLEVHHRDGNHANFQLSNQVLLHIHCHDQTHAHSINDNDPCPEEPDDGKPSCPVLERRRGGRPPRRP